MNKTNILILGGGFGGTKTALALAKQLKNRNDCQITLIDRNNYQTFHPSLYEVASAFGITHDDPYYQQLRKTISVPFDEIFAGKKVKTIQADIEQVDLAGKRVITRGGEKFSYDYLVLAFGSEVSTYNIPGVMEYTYKFKTVDDALLLFQDIEEVYKKHDQSKLPIRHLVIGAGFTGIELASELSLCTTHIAHKHGITVDKCTSIALAEAGPQILPMIDEWERLMIRKRLGELGIEIMENMAIAEIKDENTALLKDGKTITADFIVWTAGVKAPEILKSIDGLELNQTGRIVVNEFMQIKNNHHIFAIGDSIVFNDPATQKPVPQVAFLAMDQGNVAARNIAKLIRGNNLLMKFIPAYSVWIAPVGGKNAVAHTKYLVFDGFLGYVFREMIDARYFLSILPLTKTVKLIFSRIKIFIKND